MVEFLIGFHSYLRQFPVNFQNEQLTEISYFASKNCLILWPVGIDVRTGSQAEGTQNAQCNHLACEYHLTYVLVRAVAPVTTPNISHQLNYLICETQP